MSSSNEAKYCFAYTKVKRINHLPTYTIKDVEVLQAEGKLYQMEIGNLHK